MSKEQIKEQVAKIIDKALMADMVDGRIGTKPYAEAIHVLYLPLIEQAKQEERKVIGEWLEKRRQIYPPCTEDGYYPYAIQETEIQALKSGVILDLIMLAQLDHNLEELKC